MTNKELEKELEKTNNCLGKLLSCLYGNTLGLSDIDFIMSDKPAFMKDMKGKEELINISKEEIGDKMFFVREEDSHQPIAVIKVADLLEKEVKKNEDNLYQRRARKIS